MVDAIQSLPRVIVWGMILAIAMATVGTVLMVMEGAGLSSLIALPAILLMNVVALLSRAATRKRLRDSGDLDRS